MSAILKAHLPQNGINANESIYQKWFFFHQLFRHKFCYSSRFRSLRNKISRANIFIIELVQVIFAILDLNLLWNYFCWFYFRYLTKICLHRRIEKFEEGGKKMIDLAWHYLFCKKYRNCLFFSSLCNFEKSWLRKKTIISIFNSFFKFKYINNLFLSFN